MPVQAQQEDRQRGSEMHWYVDNARGFKILVPVTTAVSTSQFNQVVFSEEKGTITVSTMPNYNQNHQVAETKKALNKMCDAAVASSDATEISRSMISLNGNPGYPKPRSAISSKSSPIPATSLSQLQAHPAGAPCGLTRLISTMP
jgi:hypothetical protein